MRDLTLEIAGLCTKSKGVRRRRRAPGHVDTCHGRRRRTRGAVLGCTAETSRPVPLERNATWSLLGATSRGP